MNTADRALQFVTAFLLDDVESQELLLAESDDPVMVEALANLACGFLRNMAARDETSAPDLWRATLSHHAEHMA